MIIIVGIGSLPNADCLICFPTYYKAFTERQVKIMNNEIWKDIKGYEGFYKVSNLGRIKSFHNNTKITNKDSCLKPTSNSTGYLVVTLYKTGERRKKYLVHRLVAEAFIDNPNNYEMVNHKDECKTNNNVENLEWCDVAYNNAYGTAAIRGQLKRNDPVEAFTSDGYSIGKFRSTGIAAEIFGVSSNCIRNACKGIILTACGYKWKYINQNEY